MESAESEESTTSMKTTNDSPCLECQNRMLQPDLFSKEYEEIVGCNLLSKTKWDEGLTDVNKGFQLNCPIKTK